MADFIEKHYGVNILFGDECQDIVTTGFSLGKKAGGRTPLQKALSSPNYENEIQIVDDCFLIYPPGFFTHFSSEEASLGLRILLPYSVLARGEREMAGVTTIQDNIISVDLFFLMMLPHYLLNPFQIFCWNGFFQFPDDVHRFAAGMIDICGLSQEGIGGCAKSIVFELTNK